MALIAFAFLAVAATPLRAQAPPRPDSAARVPAAGDSAARAARLDSLAERLARAEANIALLRDQLATESSTQVRLRSRLRLDLHARILTNAFFTSAQSSNPEVPLFALATSTPNDEYGSAGGRAFGVSIRQTTVGGSVSADSVLGATFSADAELDFFGGNSADGSNLFPPPRLRTARGFLRWTRTELMVGADTPLISDLDPYGVAAIAAPDFSAAGNLWNWLPQVRLTRELGAIGGDGRSVHFAVQGSVMHPFANDRHVEEPDGVDAGLRSARPSLEGRLRAQWGREHEAPSSQRLADRGGEIGIGGHRGWLRASGDTLLSSWAVSADARIGLTHGFELRGEGYRGRLLRGLGGGGIGQNFATSTDADHLGEPLTDTAGWLQLNAQPSAVTMLGAGCGTDRVHNGRPLRQRNTACATHISWRPAAPLLFDIEYRTMFTRGPSGRHRTSHINIAFGVEL